MPESLSTKFHALLNAAPDHKIHLKHLALFTNIAAGDEANSPVSPDDLRIVFQTTPADIQGLVSKLTAQTKNGTDGVGWVTTEPHPYDRRMRLLRLTPAGREFYYLLLSTFSAEAAVTNAYSAEDCHTTNRNSVG